MIKEVDENSLENYVEILKKSIRENNANKFKENKFAIKKLIELKKDLTEKINKLKLTLQESKNTQNFANKLHNTNIKNNVYNNTNKAQDSSKIASATKQLITYSQKYNISLAYNQIKILDNEIKRYNCQNYDVYHLIYKFYYLTSNNEVRKILEQLAKNFC